jgi:hypothetical protein
VSAGLAAILAAGGVMLAAQAPTNAGHPTTAQSAGTKTATGTTSLHVHHAKRKTKAVAAEDPKPLKPALPVAPPAPDWPANAGAKPASVEWNGQNLSIGATNASLQQILRDVSTATGVKVEGMGSDQRVFGSFGPAPARDVLAELLEGSGYNMLMVGDLGQGTPRELVLSSKTSGAGAPGQNRRVVQQNDSGESEAQDEPEPQPDPAPPERRFPAGQQQGRSPAEMMQQMQQRQQQMQQQIQNGQPAQPGQPPQPQQ